MKKIFVLILGLSLSFSLFAQNDIEKEKEAIKNVIQTAYVDGLQNEGNIEKVEKGFHPSFVLLGPAKGNATWSLPIYNWIESTKQGIKEGKFPKPDDKKVTIEFEYVDVEGGTAVAKFKFLVGGVLKYIDWHSLYKFEDGWKIVHKIYHTVPEAK